MYVIQKKMYTILQKLDGIHERLDQIGSASYRGQIKNGSVYFIKSDVPGWVPATAEQHMAFEKFLDQDTSKIFTDKDNGKYFLFKFIGAGMGDKRYAIQDRTPPHKFREIIQLPDDGYVE